MVFTCINHIVAVVALLMAVGFVFEWVRYGEAAKWRDHSTKIVAMLGVLVTCLGAEAALSGYTRQPPSGLFALAFSKPGAPRPFAGPTAENRPEPPEPVQPSNRFILGDRPCDDAVTRLLQVLADQKGLSESDYNRRGRALMEELRACGEQDPRYERIANRLDAKP